MDTHEASLYTAILISSTVIGIIIGYFVISIVRQQRRNLELHRLNILTEINTLEQERNRMSADLHDEFAPVLSVIKFSINSVETNNPEDEQQLREASTRIDDVISRLREIARNLMPSALTRKGLVPALEEFITSANQGGMTHITLNATETPSLSQEKSINVFRVLQEIINNTLKHAGAQQLVIQLREQSTHLQIITQDDGKGFDYKAVLHSSSGLGLRNVKSRVEIMGGDIQIRTAPQQGSQYVIKIPL